MYGLYSVLLAFGLLLSLPYWLVQWLRHDKYRAGLRERFGRVPARLPDGSALRVLWVHAVSVGELLAVSGLIVELKRAFPQHRVFISTTTATGQTLAQARFGRDSVFYFPLDFAFAIRPYLRRLRPELVVIAETEFWPNFLRLAHDGGARLAIVNARISDRSFPGYRRWRQVLRRLLTPIDLFLAQTEEDRQRLIKIGADADRVQVSGNLKFDVAVPPDPPIVESLRNAFQRAGAGPVLVCGSTVDGEEKMLLDAFATITASHSHATLILAPRHPERFGEVVQLLEKSAIAFQLRSAWNGEAPVGGVLLLDSVGELACIYGLATLAFVGGSLVPRGGHNILEPARYGVPILVGPHTENFRDIINLFRGNNAVRVVAPSELATTFLELLSNDDERKSLGARGSETLRAHSGATQATLRALNTLLGSSSRSASQSR